MPISTVAESDMNDIAVKLRITLSSSRCTPRREHPRLAILGVITLDHAHAAQRFGQPPGDFGVDLSAFAEDGPNGLERPAQHDAENEHDRRAQSPSSAG